MTMTNEIMINGEMLSGDALINWLEGHVAKMDKRDPFHAVFLKQFEQLKESEAELKKVEEKVQSQQDNIRKGVERYLYSFVHSEDEQTIPYLMEKYKDDLDGLVDMIDDIELKFIELHKNVYEVDEFKTVYLDNISCCAEFYHENYDKFEETKGINTFIGAVTYLDMCLKSGEISDNRLVELCEGLFWSDDDECDCFKYLTDGVLVC